MTKFTRRCGHTEDSNLARDRRELIKDTLCAACWQGIEEDKAVAIIEGPPVSGCPTWAAHDKIKAIELRHGFITWFCTVARPAAEARATDEQRTAAADAFRFALQQTETSWWIRQNSGPADILRNILRAS